MEEALRQIALEDAHNTDNPETAHEDAVLSEFGL